MLTRVENPLPFGIAITEEDGRILKFLEKPAWGEVFSDTINTGIYIFEKEIFKYIPEYKEFDFSKDLFPKLMSKNINIYGALMNGYWKDVGNLTEYRLAHQDVLDGVRVVVQAIADYLQKVRLKEKGLIVGYDSRFMGEWYAKEAVKILAANNIKTYLMQRETPTPVISYEILEKGSGGAINFTASHNPPEYNGLKFSPSWAGPALPETTSWIAKRANELLGQFAFKEEFSLDKLLKNGIVEVLDPRKDYIDAIKEKIDFSVISNS